MIDLDWEEPGRMSLAGQCRGQNPILLKEGITRREFLVHYEGTLQLGLTSALFDPDDRGWVFTAKLNQGATILSVEEVIRVAMPIWPEVEGRVRQLTKDEGEQPGVLSR
jgi:hypothetical protein